jgi:RNA polymerase primary sigma factor
MKRLHKKAPKTRRARKPARSRPAGRAGARPEAVASAFMESDQEPKVKLIEEPAPARTPAAPETTTAAPESMLQLYLREIGQVKLLTPQEEIQLARRIQKGDDQAREHMIKANLRLVVKIAREYENLGLPLLDLINEGNMGLMKGVERFDPTKGAKLSTYASWWIKQSIKRALANQSKTIRLPVHVVDKVADIRRAEMKLKEKLDREPTDEELAEMLGLKPQRVREYREAARAPVSLDAPLGHDDDSEHISEVVADTRAEAPYANLSKDTDKALLKEVFATLSPREQHILTLRFGLQDDTPKTLEEIGQEYRLTRERIRQIESEGLQKLRARMAKRDSLALEGVLALSE